MSTNQRFVHLREAERSLTNSPRWVRHVSAERIAFVYGMFAVALVPWSIYLATTLPSRNLSRGYNVTWAGFDLWLVGLLAHTAWYAYKRDVRVVLPAAATGALLIADAWFDITTAHSGRAMGEAVASAVLLEIPAALISMELARRALGHIAAGPPAPDLTLPAEDDLC